MPIKIRLYELVWWLFSQAASLFYSLHFESAAMWCWAQAYGWGDNVTAWNYFEGDKTKWQEYVDGRDSNEFPEVKR